MSSGFLDTNILVYAHSADARSERARTLLAHGGVTGVQCLNEFVRVAIGKLKFEWPQVREALEGIRSDCTVAGAIDLDSHERSLVLAERYGYRIFDALVLDAALQAGCTTFWSEDMQHGQVIDDRLTIRDPFR